MESSTYISLSRQSGLMNEMRIVANNIANAATTGYRQQGVMFSEFVRSAPGQASLSMCGCGGRPSAGGKRMARYSQASWQAWQ